MTPDNERKPIAIAYRRVSTMGQSEYGHSMEAQDAEIDRWIIAHGYERAEQSFCDPGISGKKLKNRPGVLAAISLACQFGKKNGRTKRPVLVVHSLSRLARSTKELNDVLEELQKANCDLASCTEPFDTTTIEGKMLFGILAVLAEFERGLCSKRTKAIAGHLRDNHRKNGKSPRYGWQYNEKEAVPNPTEQALVARAKALRSQGVEVAKIAEIINSEGHRTRGNGLWCRASVYQRLLRKTE